MVEMSSNSQQMQKRKQRERAFHNKSFAEGTRVKTHKYYLVSKQDTEFYDNFLKTNAEGKSVLEYGCGTGSLINLLLGARAKKTTGIDISEVAIGQAKQKYEKEVAAGKVSFQVMDAEALEFSDSTFNLICGKSILHHLDLQKCYAEISRVLKSEGKAIFLEPLGHNPIINLYRKVTPKLRTVDEHPLLQPDMHLASKYFQQVELHYFRLTSIFAIPFRKFGFFSPLLQRLDAFDQFLFRRAAFIRKFARIAIMILSKPRNTNA